MKDFINVLRIINKFSEVSKKKIFISIVISIFIALLQSLPVKLIQNIMDKGFIEKNYNIILSSSLLLIIIYVLKSSLSYLLNKMCLNISKKLTQDLRATVFNTILNSDYEIYSQYDSSYINHRINEISSIGDIFSPNIFNILTTIIEAFFVFIFLLKVNLPLLIVSVFPIPILFFIVKHKNNKLEENTKVLMEKSSRQTQRITEKIAGIEFIQKNNKQNNEIASMKLIDKDVLEYRFKQGILIKRMTELITFYVSILPILLYIFGGYMYMHYKVTLGSIITFSANISKVYAPFLSIAILNINIKSIIASGRRMLELLEEFKKSSVEDNKQQFNVHSIDKIVFSNVSFKYSKASKMLFEDINFTLNTGDILNISGKNGTGKSTILKLLLGLLSPTSGIIRINDIELDKIDLKSVRNKIGIVDQNVFLFNDTIENNILYAVEGGISKNKLLDILKILSLDSSYDIETIKNKEIGQNGKNLSGGERQKIALARVLLKNADLIIFDESISNVDLKTREDLKNIIKTKLKNKIIILVDHNNYFDDVISKKIVLQK